MRTRQLGRLPCDDVGVKRLPRPALRPFVEAIWALDEGLRASATRREHVLPTGAMHLVFRLSDNPLRLFDDERDREGRVVSTMVVGGSRARFYIRDASRPLCSVGAVLRPGAAEVLFGVGADALSERHTALEDLWGARAVSMRDELAEQLSIEERFEVFERMLAARLPAVGRLHPAVAHALRRFDATETVHQVVRAATAIDVYRLVFAGRRPDAKNVLPGAALPAGASPCWKRRVHLVDRHSRRRWLQRPVSFQPRVPGVHRRHAH